MPTSVLIECDHEINLLGAEIEQLEPKAAPSAYGGDYGAPNLGQWGCL